MALTSGQLRARKYDMDLQDLRHCSLLIPYFRKFRLHIDMDIQAIAERMEQPVSDDMVKFLALNRKYLQRVEESSPDDLALLACYAFTTVYKERTIGRRPSNQIRSMTAAILRLIEEAPFLPTGTTLERKMKIDKDFLPRIHSGAVWRINSFQSWSLSGGDFCDSSARVKIMAVVRSAHIRALCVAFKGTYIAGPKTQTVLKTTGWFNTAVEEYEVILDHRNIDMIITSMRGECISAILMDKKSAKKAQLESKYVCASDTDLEVATPGRLSFFARLLPESSKVILESSSLSSSYKEELAGLLQHRKNCSRRREDSTFKRLLERHGDRLVSIEISPDFLRGTDSYDYPVLSDVLVPREVLSILAMRKLFFQRYRDQENSFVEKRRLFHDAGTWDVGDVWIAMFEGSCCAQILKAMWLLYPLRSTSMFGPAFVVPSREFAPSFFVTYVPSGETLREEHSDANCFAEFRITFLDTPNSCLVKISRHVEAPRPTKRRRVTGKRPAA